MVMLQVHICCYIVSDVSKMGTYVFDERKRPCYTHHAESNQRDAQQSGIKRHSDTPVFLHPISERGDDEWAE